MTVAPVLERVGDFAVFLEEPFDEDAANAGSLRAESIGRPIGNAQWLKALELRTGRRPAPRPKGPKPQAK